MEQVNCQLSGEGSEECTSDKISPSKTEEMTNTLRPMMHNIRQKLCVFVCVWVCVCVRTTWQIKAHGNWSFCKEELAESPYSLCFTVEAKSLL